MSLEDLLPDSLNTFGWGPDLKEVPKKFTEIPYAPFSKEEGPGKIYDWYHKRKAYPQRQVQTKSIFYFRAQKEDKFRRRSVLPSKPVAKKHHKVSDQIHRMRQQERQRREEEEKKNTDRRYNKNNKVLITKAQKSKMSTKQTHRVMQTEVREASMTVQTSWKKIDHFDFVMLNKEQSALANSQPETLRAVGKLLGVDKSYEKVNTKKTVPLRRTTKGVYKVSTSEDPLIAEYAKEGVANVFATDAVVSLLMAATRTVYSWDIVITKENGKLFLDKRKDNDEFHVLSVNETSAEVPSSRGEENMNGKFQLGREATSINHCFCQQLINSDAPSQEPLLTYDDSPFTSASNVAPTAFYYKVWTLAEDLKVLIRSEANAAVEVDDEEEPEVINIHALNEFDSKATQWRQKLDGQRGSVFATELKNNSNKITRWVVESYLNESSRLVFGFVTRTKERDNENHTVLGSYYYKTVDLFKQLGLKPSNLWGILRLIIEVCLEQEDGRYILIKEPNNSRLVLYSVPPETQN